jgi:translation initiation factor IF-1
MGKEDAIEMQGEVEDNLPNATFRVKLEMATVLVHLRQDAHTTFASCRETRSLSS